VTRFTGAAWRTNHDRCVVCGRVFSDAPPDAEVHPPVPDAQIREVLDAIKHGDQDAAAWLDAQWMCQECRGDIAAQRARFGPA